jgi:hypothetical protein
MIAAVPLLCLAWFKAVWMFFSVGRCCIDVSYCMLLKNLAGFDWVGYNGWPMLKHLTDLHSMLFGILYLWVRIGK